MNSAQPALRTCSRCLYDTTMPGIRFDAQGVCQFCATHDILETKYPLDASAEVRLHDVVAKIKLAGTRRNYDCVVGVSGGVDSTYTLYKAVQLGLRPLAVHFDNGWNSEIAVGNIEKATRALNVELETVVADWEEFKDLQLSFLRASVSDAEIPTDVAIHGVLHDVAAKENIRYVLIGHSFRTEGIVPKGWTYMDGKYIAGVQARFGSVKIKSFPLLTLDRLLYYWFIKQIRSVPLLNYLPYDKAAAAEILEREIGWRNYGGHHHENLYTAFFQSFYLPGKFGIDKRKLSLSARVRSGALSRDEALRQIAVNAYPVDATIVEYTKKKLGLSDQEFQEIMGAPRRSFLDYPTYFPLIWSLRVPISWAHAIKLVPDILYYKVMS